MEKSLEFYVYAYLREDGTPYYIGKGRDYRAWSKRHRINLPVDEKRIVLLETNLTEVGALALERFYIRWHGRKDCNTGILHNRTDGGEGFSGMIISEETKKKMSNSQTGKTRSEQTKRRMSISQTGRKHTEESKKKIMTNHAGMRGRKLTDQHLENLSRSLKGKILSDEHKKKISIARKGMKFSSEHRKNISESQVGKKRGPYRKKKVI